VASYGQRAIGKVAPAIVCHCNDGLFLTGDNSALGEFSGHLGRARSWEDA
jgi:hypothetical protein